MDKKATILVIILLVVVAGAGAWVYAATKPSDTKNNTNTSKNNTTDTSTDNPDHSNMEIGATITATNDGFTPNTVTVKKGQMVKVVNNSSSPIEFSSADHPTHLQDPELNMSELAPGKSGEIMPEKVGSHGYHDHLRAEHTGTIIVTE